MDLCWIDGRVVPVHEAKVNVMDHGLLYGDGVFEGLRFFNSNLFRAERAIGRLFRSAAAIRLIMPMSREDILSVLRQLIDAYISTTGKEDGYIRLVVTRGVGKFGLDPASCPRANIFMIAGQLSLISRTARESGAKVIIASTRKPGPDIIDPRVKSLNYLSNILARIEASNAGADEAVMLNSSGFVAEGTAENIFIARAGKLYTPPLEDGALEGITRGAVIESAERLGIAVHVQRLAPYDLYIADEVFLTGTGAGLAPVREIGGRVKSPTPGPLFRAVEEEFYKLVEEETRPGVMA